MTEHETPKVTPEMQQHYVLDIEAISRAMQEYKEQQLQVNHKAYPALNFIAEQVKEAFPVYMINGLADMHKAGTDLALDVFTFMIALYRLGREGYEILETDCKGTHPEFN